MIYLVMTILAHSFNVMGNERGATPCVLLLVRADSQERAEDMACFHFEEVGAEVRSAQAWPATDQDVAQYGVQPILDAYREAA